ncbi:MAG: efflux RND transporter periplasmic adaptor subunit [Ferruginibacter sp.]
MKKIVLYFLLFITVLSCSRSKKEADAETTTVTEEVQTPVTVTTISNEPLEEFVELNATSSFLESNIIKASTNGYIKSVNIKMNQFVGRGQTAFVLQTKEAKALGNTINKLDASFHFTGIINIPTTASGYITQLSHHAGDYVQDGEQLAVLSDTKSFGFLLNLPYELRPYISANKSVTLELPDRTHLTGTVTTILPALDSVSQTLAVMIKVNSTVQIPQNLIAKVTIIKAKKENTPSLPKEAILTDDAQENFWVMKMIDSITAVKIPVTKGMESSGFVEIKTPQFAMGDKILLSGNYGLPDTAKVKIIKSEK